MHRSQVLRPQGFLFPAIIPYPCVRKTRRAALFVATALTGSFVLAPTLTTRALAAGSTNVTTTAGDTSAGSLRGAAQDLSDYQIFVFQNLGSAATINLGGPLTFTHASAVSLQFGGTTTSLTIGGDTISAASHLYFQLNNSSYDLTLNSALNFTSGADIALVQGGTVTFNGDISDVGILQVTSNGTAVIGTTTAPAGFDINSGGTLRFATAGTYSSNLEIENTATIDTGAYNVAISGAVTDDGTNTLVKTGSGMLTLSGTNTASGTMRIDAGTLSITADGNLSAGTLTFNGGNLAITGVTTIDNAVALASSATITNSADAALSGVISGAGNLTKAGASTLTLTGTNTYSGGTTISSGTLQIGDGGTTGSLTGDIVNNAALAFNRSDAMTFNGVISGTGSVTKSGTGTLILTGANSHTGGTTISAGTLQIGDGGTTGSLARDIVNNAALTFNRSDAMTFNGVISGTGSMTKSSTGTLILTGANSHTGGTTISAGTLQIGDGGTTGSLAGDIVNNAALTFNRSDAMTFNGDISGTGSVTKSGSGTLTLTGANTFTGGTTVAGGLLTVNGSTGDIVLNGGTLGGSGTVGSVTANSGASVAPGNSIGTLNVSGNVIFSSGSTYEVEVDSAGKSDKLAAAGTAAIDSGATVTVSAENGTDTGSTYAASTTYTILTADGGVTGAFGSVSENFAYLDAALGYDANNVTLTLTRNATGLATPAETANQRAAAHGVSSLEAGNSVLGAVVVLSEAGARAAFDNLSGEIHASTDTLLIQESRFGRNAIGARIRSAFDGIAAADMSMIAFHGSGEAPGSPGGPVAWGQAYGSWGQIDGNRNAATMDHTSGGFFVGADTQTFGGWRAGLMAGYGNSRFDVDARASSGHADSYTLGAYAGRQFGPLGLRFGTTYAWYDVTTTRNVSAGTLSNNLRADYTASTAQAFGEAGYTLETRLARLEPFAGAALIHQHSDGFSETGGAAALTVSSASRTLGVTSLGLRAERPLAEVGPFNASVTGSLAWRHAFGDLDAASTMRFATGDAFAISGTPLDRDSALIEAGFRLGLGEGTNVSLTYQGDIGATSRDHGFNARFSARF